jgi:hypothetical protein
VRRVGGALVYTISKDVAFREVDGSILLVDLKTGSYFSLNATASFVFRLISRDKTTAEIASEMAAFYRVSEETARRDVEECIAGLIREGILKVNGGQGNAPSAP